ncbi:MAG: MerR family transcriptional regulator [Chloroflexota bacterium]
MDRRFYRTGQFARRAGVTVRTLRFYDKERLLTPAQHSEAGYRLYTDEDLADLQQILALKFLGFSLDEIKALLRAGSGPRTLGDVLAQQKAMMQAKRSQLDGIISAITQTEQLLASGQSDWDSLVTVIHTIRMEQNKDWAKKYFTPEQLDRMQSLSDLSYSDEAQAKIAARTPEWTEADQQRIAPLWDAVNQDITRLAAQNADPASPEAQELAARYSNLIQGFTGGDPEISKGLNKWWENFSALPEDQKPFQSPYSNDQMVWLNKALSIYRNSSK